MPEATHYRGSHLHRPQSPGVEYAIQDELRRVLALLLESKGLYQNVAVDVAVFREFSDPSYSAASLVSEFKARPFIPRSRGEGDDPDDHLGKMASLANNPIGTAHDKLNLGFYLPNVQLDCLGCKKPCSFLSMSCSGAPYAGTPYPVFGTETEQVFTLYYRCAGCRNSYLVFQVRRVGLKLQLTGRSLPHRPSVSAEWPKRFRPIVSAALAANAEGDTAAAYYHLRTALEHLMKHTLGMSVLDKIEGTKLCEQYAALMPAEFRSTPPSVARLYTELSEGLHTRKVDSDCFAGLVQQATDHLIRKKLFERYANAGS